MAKNYDLVVLGSGSAGYRVAMRCRKAGWKVAVIDDYLIWGGTCDNRGCTPKKVLVGAAEVADLARRYQGVGVVTQLPELDWARLIEFKTSFIAATSDNTKTPLREAGVDLFEGEPRFVSDDTLEVNGERLQSKHFHIAVGAKPAKLTFDGAEHLITSEDFLSLTALPKKMVFVGGGYVSFELANVAARFGVKATILHGDDHPLAAFDPDLVQGLIAATEEAGIEVVLNSRVDRVEKRSQGVAVHASGKEFAAGMAVNGAGRPPAIDTLNLEAAGVKFERRGVTVNEHLQSVSNPRVYAGGDAAAGGPPLSPVARLHGTIVADNLLGTPSKQPNYHSTPSVVFTEPPLAKVGLLESEAQEQGLDVTVKLSDTSGWFDARRTNLKHSLAKTLVDKKTNRIVGAHLLGNRADDLINMFALAVEAGITVDQWTTPVYTFPTTSDDTRYLF